MFVARVDNGQLVIIGETKLNEPPGAKQQLLNGGDAYELNFVTEDAIRAWRERNARDPVNGQFERAQRAIILRPDQEARRLPGFRYCKR